MPATNLQLIAAAEKYVKAGNERNALRNLDLLRQREAPRAAAIKTLIAATGPELSHDPQVALAQILMAIGHPVVVNEQGQSLAIDPVSALAACDPEQNRELALLGFFGTAPGHPDLPGVDWSLHERYYDHDAEGNSWPKEQYASTGTWQSYMDGD